MFGGVLMDLRRCFTAWAYHVLEKELRRRLGQADDSEDDGAD
jgi:hypothetical protein